MKINECLYALANRIAGGFSPQPHATQDAGAHRAVDDVCRAVAV